MKIFYMTLAISYIFSLGSVISRERHKLFRYFMLLITMIVIIAVSGLRANIGDTHAYIEGYKSLANFNGFNENSKDIGFTIFTLFLYKISTNPQFMIFMTSFITQFFNIYNLYKYNNAFELSIYMYITSGYFLTTMNGIRQSLVAAILFACTKLIIKGKFKIYLLIVVILSTLHGSALIMIPIYFIVRKEPWSKNTLIIVLLSSMAFLMFYEFIPIVFDILGESSQYAGYEDDLLSGGEGGATLMRWIVDAVPVVLAYLNKEKLKELWPDSKIFVNMSIINLIIMEFSLRNWIFARLSIYLQLYNFILLPYIIKNCIEKKEEKNLIYYSFMMCYFIFFYYEQVIGGVGLGYKSNYINL